MEGRRTQKTKLILSLLRWFNLRLGATPYRARVYHAPYQKKKFMARAPHSFDTAREALERLLKALDGLRGWTTCSRSTQSARLRRQKSSSSRTTQWISSEALYVCRTRLRRARGLVRPGTAGLPTGTKYSRVGSST